MDEIENRIINTYLERDWQRREDILGNVWDWKIKKKKREREKTMYVKKKKKKRKNDGEAKM